MSAWIQIPCLVALRSEFNAVAPGRDKGADGSIGDSSHTSSSDHTPDEDSDVLRDHDADDKNEVHALDIDSTGPWPDGKGGGAGGWFDRTILAIAEREREEYLSPTMFGRLQNIIWRGRIISRSWGWSEWRARSQNDHFDHAHFSARYLTRTESDTRPWGVEEDDMTEAELVAGVTKALKAWAEENPDSTATPKETLRVGGLLRMSEQRARNRHAALLAAITGVDTDEQAIAATVLAGLPVAAIAAAIPAELSEQVVTAVLAKLPKASADELLARLAS